MDKCICGHSELHHKYGGGRGFKIKRYKRGLENIRVCDVKYCVCKKYQKDEVKKQSEAKAKNIHDVHVLEAEK